jgi:hypothetical protein
MNGQKIKWIEPGINNVKNRETKARIRKALEPIKEEQ